MNEPWWARLLAALLDLLSGWSREQGRIDVRTEQQEAADALRKDYDEINADGRSLDDALGRLRRRTKAGDGDSLPKP